MENCEASVKRIGGEVDGRGNYCDGIYNRAIPRIVEGNVYFAHTKIPGILVGENCSIGGDIDLSAAEIGQCYLKDVKGGNDLELYRTKIKGDFTLINSYVKNTLHLDCAKIEGDIKISDTSFGDELVIVDTQVKEWITLEKIVLGREPGGHREFGVIRTKAKSLIIKDLEAYYGHLSDSKIESVHLENLKETYFSIDGLRTKEFRIQNSNVGLGELDKKTKIDKLVLENANLECFERSEDGQIGYLGDVEIYNCTIPEEIKKELKSTARSFQEKAEPRQLS
jgi:hypothetical protein